jgi:hypothetical protein
MSYYMTIFHRKYVAHGLSPIARRRDSRMSGVPDVRLLGLLGLWLLLVLVAFAGSATGNTLEGRVVRVIDGDTLVLLVAGNVEERIRLSGIVRSAGRRLGHGRRRHSWGASAGRRFRLHGISGIGTGGLSGRLSTLRAM